MKHEKTFEAINKLKDVEIELHRLKNLLEITGRALDAKSEWVGLTEEELIVIKGKTCPEIDWSARHGVPLNNGEQNAWLFTWFMAFAKEIEAKLKQKNNIGVND